MKAKIAKLQQSIAELKRKVKQCHETIQGEEKPEPLPNNLTVTQVLSPPNPLDTITNTLTSNQSAIQ